MSRQLSDWAADGECLLREELAAADAQLSRKLIEAALWPVAAE